MGLEVDSHSNWSSAVGLWGSLPLRRGHPRQTGPWKSSVRELGGCLPVVRADGGKGSSQWVTSCLTLLGSSVPSPPPSGSPSGMGSRTSRGAELPTTPGASPKRGLSCSRCPGAAGSGSGREFAGVLPGRWSGGRSGACPVPAFLSLYGTRASGACPAPCHACLSKHVRHAAGDSGGRGAARPCHRPPRGRASPPEQRWPEPPSWWGGGFAGQGGGAGSSGVSSLSRCGS